MSLFQWGDFTLHSGGKSWWRIDCDALSGSEIYLLARLMVEVSEPFYMVSHPESHPGSCVPKLALAVHEEGQLKWRDVKVNRVFLVDDVLTTGRSMEDLAQGYRSKGAAEVRGAVIFSRGECPDWITPIFQLKI